MDSREAILSNIRDRTLPLDKGNPPVIPMEVPMPEYAIEFDKDKPSQFIHMLNQVHGSCDRLDEIFDLPQAVKKYLLSLNEQLSVLMSLDETISSLDWNEFQTAQRPAEKFDRISITLANAGIVETGTIVMLSSPRSPITHNFLPEINVVVLFESTLVSTIEEIWPMIENQPRAINFITGPSKTADIEQTIVYGAHGPRKFHVMMIAD